MAIYHLSVKPVQRSKGRTATAAAAYRAGVSLKDERTGEVHDYTRKQGVEHTELIFPSGVNMNREQLWNIAESSEVRKDGTPAREYEIALPSELNTDERRELAREFGNMLVQKYGVAVDIAIHAPNRTGDQRNYHAHILATTRRFEDGTLRSKTDFDLSDRDRKKKGLESRRSELESIRAEWAHLVNHALDKAKLQERVTHKSHAARGLEVEPTCHLGPTATAMERRGIQTERGNFNREAKAINARIQEINVEFAEIAKATEPEQVKAPPTEEVQSHQELESTKVNKAAFAAHLDALARSAEPHKVDKYYAEWAQPYIDAVERQPTGEMVEDCLQRARHDASPEGKAELQKVRNVLDKCVKGIGTVGQQSNMCKEALNAYRMHPDRMRDGASALGDVKRGLELAITGLERGMEL